MKLLGFIIAVVILLSVIIFSIIAVANQDYVLIGDMFLVGLIVVFLMSGLAVLNSFFGK